MTDLQAFTKHFKAAQTRHDREQLRGQTDGSARQTRRMYLAAENLRKWAGKVAREQASPTIRNAYGIPQSKAGA